MEVDAQKFEFQNKIKNGAVKQFYSRTENKINSKSFEYRNGGKK